MERVNHFFGYEAVARIAIRQGLVQVEKRKSGAAPPSLRPVRSRWTWRIRCAISPIPSCAPVWNRLRAASRRRWSAGSDDDPGRRQNWREEEMKSLFMAGAAALVLPSPPAAAAAATTPGSRRAAARPVANVAAPNGDWTQTVAATERGFRMGNPNAPVKLVEYASITCPHCAEFSAEGGGGAASRPMSAPAR